MGAIKVGRRTPASSNRIGESEDRNPRALQRAAEPLFEPDAAAPPAIRPEKVTAAGAGMRRRQKAKPPFFQAKPPADNPGVRLIPRRDDRAFRSKCRRLL